jgi:hypothetical protein
MMHAASFVTSTTASLARPPPIHEKWFDDPEV